MADDFWAIIKENYPAGYAPHPQDRGDWFIRWYPHLFLLACSAPVLVFIGMALWFEVVA